MPKDHRRMNPYILALPVLAIGLQDSASATISPAISSIAATYPNINTSLIQLMVSLPALTTCIVAPVYGFLSNKIQPRKLVLFGLICFILGGMMPVLLHSFPMIMACRLLVGIGAGLTVPACDTIIPRLYSGQMREYMMGYNSAVGGLGCMVMVYIGGRMAMINWHFSFLGYGIGAITLLLVLFLLPNIPMPEKPKGAVGKVNVFQYIHKLAYLEILMYFIAVTFMTWVTSNISLFIEGEGIGTAVSSGTVGSMHLLGAAAGAVSYGFLKKKLKYYVIPFSWGIVGLGFFLFAHSSTIVEAYLSMILGGIGVGTIWPSYCIRMSELSLPISTAVILSIAASFQGFGTFINPIVGGAITRVLNIGYGRESILVSGIAMLAGAVLITLVHTAFFRNGKDMIVINE